VARYNFLKTSGLRVSMSLFYSLIEGG
jgi:hypothetical protein